MLVLAGSILLAASSASALVVEGETRHQMRFRGTVESVAGGYVKLIHSGNSRQLGIPVSDILAIRPAGGSDPGSAIPELFQYPAVLHLWDGPVHEGMTAHLESLAMKGAWTDCYHAACMLESVTGQGPLLQRIHMAKAWALYELGLRGQCYLVLDAMDAYLDPSEVPVRYCWIRSRQAKSAGDMETATYWCLLPMLRIPADTSDLALEMYRECESTQKGSK